MFNFLWKELLKPFNVVIKKNFLFAAGSFLI